MTDEKERFVAILKNWLPLVLSLVTVISTQAAMIEDRPKTFRVAAVSVAAVGATILWILLLSIYRRKRPSTHDPRKKHPWYSKGKRVAALTGLIVLPMLAAGVADVLIKQQRARQVAAEEQRIREEAEQKKREEAERLARLGCPPLTVTIAKFSGPHANVDYKIRTDLENLLRGQWVIGAELRPNKREYQIPDQGWEEDQVRAAKLYGNSLEGCGHLLVWGQIASEREVWANVTIVNNCNGTRDDIDTPGTASNATKDNFKRHFTFAEDIMSATEPLHEVIDFVRFVTGVALYKEGKWQECVNLLEGVKWRFGAFYKGLAWQQIGRHSRQSRDLNNAINAYHDFVGPGPDWEFQDENEISVNDQSMATAVAACINAANAFLELSELESARREAHLTTAVAGYNKAIELYDRLDPGDLGQNSWKRNLLTIADTDLAVAKIKLAENDLSRKSDWLHEAENDFRKILNRLGQNNDAGSEYWADAKANLGGVCFDLSRLESDRKGRLLLAKEAFEGALNALDNIDKANTSAQNESAYKRAVLEANLGAASTALATDEPARDVALEYLRQAEDHYNKANDGFLRDPYYSAEFAENLSDLGVVFTERARLSDDAEAEELLGKAEDNHIKALTACRKADHPLEWALISRNLAYAKREHGRRLGSRQLLAASVDLYQDSLAVLSQLQLKTYWASAKYNLGESLYELGRVTADIQKFRDAITAYKAARDVWTPERAEYDLKNTQRALKKAEAYLDKPPKTVITAVAASRTPRSEGKTPAMVPPGHYGICGGGS